MRVSKILQEKMEFLANLEETTYPFITLYLNVNAQHFLEQMEKNRIFLKNSFNEWEERLREENNRDALQSFRTDMDLIYRYLENEMDTSTHGLAIFACNELGIWQVFESVMPFDNYFHVNSFPHLSQLAYQADEYENSLLVLLDSRHSQIFQIKLGGFITEKQEITNDVHRFHKQGGWAQRKYQRGIELEKDIHYKETADALTRISDEEGFDNIIIFGQDFEIKNFQTHLPKRIASKIMDTGSAYPKDNTTHILELAMEKLQQKELKDELETINELITRAEGKDGCSTGIDETIELAKDGRVRILTLLKDSTFAGYRRGDCLFAQEADFSKCPTFDGVLQETDLAEEAVRLTLKNRGEVEIVHRESIAGYELEKFGSIGAYLRY